MLRVERRIYVADYVFACIAPALDGGVLQGACEISLELHVRQLFPGYLLLLLLRWLLLRWMLLHRRLGECHARQQRHCRGRKLPYCCTNVFTHGH
jgi:hypothetical protein